MTESSHHNPSVKAYNKKRINQGMHEEHKMHSIKLKQCQIIKQSYRSNIIELDDKLYASKHKNFEQAKNLFNLSLQTPGNPMKKIQAT